MGHGEKNRLVRWGTGRKIDWSDGARGGKWTGQMRHGEEDRLVRWGTGRKMDWSDWARGGR